MARSRMLGATGFVAGLLCVAAPTAVALDQPVVTLDEPVGVVLGEDARSGWTLVLAEDFERIDPRRWTLKDDTYSSNEDSFLRADNCSIDAAGKDRHALRLQAKQEQVRRWGDTWDYTSCYATTEGTYSLPEHFRAEVRAKVPMEQGMWAAPLWLRPADHSGGEIDVAETIGGETEGPLLHQTIHTDYGPEHEQSSYAFPFDLLGDRLGTGWHTYTIEKVPGRITMWADGVQTAQWSTGDPEWFSEYYDAGKRWALRVNLQVGGNWPGPPDAGTDWSRDRTAMLVDHIHVWTPTASVLEPPPVEGTGRQSPGRKASDAASERESAGSWLQRALVLLVPHVLRSLP